MLLRLCQLYERLADPIYLRYYSRYCGIDLLLSAEVIQKDRVLSFLFLSYSTQSVHYH